jgi:hypothetical protein
MARKEADADTWSLDAIQGSLIETKQRGWEGIIQDVRLGGLRSRHS